MIKGFLPLLFTSGGAIAAGAVGYAIVTANTPEEKPQSAAVETVAPQPAPAGSVEQEPAEETQAPADTEDSLEVAKVEPDVEAKPELPAPVFSVLRVEPDGSAVIAGSGPANSVIKLLKGGAEISRTQSGPGGDFAFVLDEPLEPGAHELTLEATLSTGENIPSNEAGLVNVPQPDKPEELAVLVAEPGQASRILVKPEPAAPDAVAKAGESVSVANKEAKASETASLEVKAEAGAEVVVEVKEIDPLKPKNENNVAQVLLEAAEIEGDRLFIAGKGEAGSTVNIYVGEELIGSAKVRENGSFLFEGVKKLSSGRYQIRADMVGPGLPDVLARAEVELLHETVEEAPKEQVVQDNVTEAETAESSTSSAEPTAASSEEKAEANVLRTGAAVIIRRGDSLWKVARRNYGAGIRYTTIFDANRDQVRNPDLIYPGQVLKVPEGEASGTASEEG